MNTEMKFEIEQEFVVSKTDCIWDIRKGEVLVVKGFM